MPGKQMAIDADLNAGILDAKEATEKREEIAKEADFYGAMDGASKFVKGDAVAGILILAINIIGGVNTGQTGLTTGRTHYVQAAGGIGLTVSSPSVVAGTSISDTRIIVKG